MVVCVKPDEIGSFLSGDLAVALSLVIATGSLLLSLATLRLERSRREDEVKAVVEAAAARGRANLVVIGRTGALEIRNDGEAIARNVVVTILDTVGDRNVPRVIDGGPFDLGPSVSGSVKLVVAQQMRHQFPCELRWSDADGDCKSQQAVRLP